MAPVKLKALLVTSEFPPHVGGIASHAAELARALAPLCDGVTVVAPRSLGEPAADFAPDGVSVLRPALVKAEPFHTPILAGRLEALATRGGFDLVHVHGVRPLAATRGLAIPTVFTNHSSGFLKRLHASPRRKARTARLLRHVRRLIAPSDELVDAARSLGYAGPAEMIPNGVDIERFRPGPAAARRAWGVGPDEVVLLLARRLAQKNGVVWFARAAGQLKALNCRIVIAGDGAERAAMIAALGETGMLGRTVFLGAVDNGRMPEVYQSADIAVLPSLAEATSIAGLEAMACGLPLVGTRVGGIPTIVKDGETGLLIPPEDADALAAAIGTLANDRTLRRRYGAAARTFAAEAFSWPSIARRTLAVYERLVTERPGRGRA